MKAHLRLITIAAFVVASGAAFAQTDEHHPDAGAPQAPLAAPAPESTPGSMPEQCTAMMSIMQKMMPMMQGVQAADSDVAFIQAMIPHHQGAIDMARAVLQFGKDDVVKAWANEIITAGIRNRQNAGMAQAARQIDGEAQ